MVNQSCLLAFTTMSAAVLQLLASFLTVSFACASGHLANVEAPPAQAFFTAPASLQRDTLSNITLSTFAPAGTLDILLEVRVHPFVLCCGTRAVWAHL